MSKKQDKGGILGLGILSSNRPKILKKSGTLSQDDREQIWRMRKEGREWSEVEDWVTRQIGCDTEILDEAGKVYYGGLYVPHEQERREFCRMADAMVKDETDAVPAYAKFADAIYKLKDSVPPGQQAQLLQDHQLLIGIRQQEMQHRVIDEAIRRRWCSSVR